ncbi:GNAT family N-acetyltransferase [Streptacidiphilus monticola]|uniref:GNAT family N-acetyltransferase n=1 Tax=Streptacidiphilus monticola TaxID=2161674 RepID=A0ABW1FX57_9ACTN
MDGLPPHPDAVAVPWGLRVDVGLPGHLARHVLLAPDEEVVRKAAAEIAAEGARDVWIKAFLDPDAVGRWLGPDWEPDAPGHLMTVQLRRSPQIRVPDGYTLDIAVEDRVAVACVRTGDGELAASGRMAVTGATTAVADQIVTQDSHQRRGLGSAVMRSLAHAALDHGARTGILAASDQGQALYRTLGWTTVAELASYAFRPAR